jgi:hypothetical protein
MYSILGVFFTPEKTLGKNEIVYEATQFVLSIALRKEKIAAS